MNPASQQFTKDLGIQYPIICGAMFPCSNPELIASVSEAGGIGIVQPMSLTYVHGYSLKSGLERIRELTKKPYGFNVIVESSQKIYSDRMREWVDLALADGCRFFITALGNPKWVVERVRSSGGIVYHDVTEKKWALKALDAGVHGLIGVNNRAGGHAGRLPPDQLFESLADLKVPVVCAGGVGDAPAYRQMLSLGYAGVQMGTRFIATNECNSKDDYKQAIVKAEAEDIVLTERVTGVPLAVIRTPYIESTGTRAGFLARWLLQHRKAKHWVRLYYTVLSAWKLKRSTLRGYSSKDYWQAGKSVEGIERIESAAEIVRRFGSQS